MTGLSPSERRHIIDVLERGETIPLDYKHLLFPPERREYELVYGAKAREEDIIAETMAVPLQPIRTFGNLADDGWNNMLIFGDNLQAMKTLLRLKEQGRLMNADGSVGVKLIYIDPPFSTRQDFRGTPGERAYQDKVAGAQFIEFLRKRLVLIRELLHPAGSLYIHLDWRKAHYIKVVLDEVFGESHFMNQIIWQRHDPHNDAVTRYGRIHDTIFWYARGDRRTYNAFEITDPLSPQAIKEYNLVEYPDGTVERWRDQALLLGARRFKVDDCTVKGRNPQRKFTWRGATPSAKRQWPYDSPEEMDAALEAGLLYLRNPERGALRCRKSYLDNRMDRGQLVQDIWLNLGRMKGGSSYPTEKPELLLDRILRASSNQGDLVLDAFAGSGTTLAVAEKLGRRWIGIDCGKLAIYTIQKRPLSRGTDVGSNGKGVPAPPFTLFNAGLYDFSELRELPWDGWRLFALNLFECRDEPHWVRGLQLDGYRFGDDVLVFNHRAGGGAVLDYGFIDDLHSQLGTAAGEQFFLIAPAASVTFLEDYVDKDDTRYYVLRIPYSIIDELHNRDFEAIRQPIDELHINDTVEAVGFDFIRAPKVRCRYVRRITAGELFCQAVVQIETFRSQAMIRGAGQLGNRESLSMILVDYDYPFDPGRQGADHAPSFAVDRVFYAADIESNDWEIRMPVEELGESVMLVYVDIYGNEHAEIKVPNDFTKSSE